MRTREGNRRTVGRRLLAGVVVATAAVLGPSLLTSASGPQPGTPEYIQRDSQNIQDAYGRQTGMQLTPQYIASLPAGTNPGWFSQIAQQLDNPNRLAADPGNVFPGWNQGNVWREGWASTAQRGQVYPIAFTNRYGALLRGHVWAPLPGAHDPYTGALLTPPFPAVVITTGSIQGSEIMYRWLAQDLAERGYVVTTYDVQGQGTSETLPHQGGPSADFPYCDPTSQPAPGEMTPCPGVPFQQTANFVYGTEDAVSFTLSTPDQEYQNVNPGSTPVNHYNPFYDLIDHSPDTQTVTPGRTTRLAIIGHSLGATAVSFVQGADPRAETVVALDKLGSSETFAGATVGPSIPALAVQSEYGFNVVPYWDMGGSSFAGQPQSPNQAPDPNREAKTGFNGWKSAGVDTMLIVPRASTHLEYTDINYALPASRYGQDLTSVYVQAWLDKYLKHDPAADDQLLASSWTYLEPTRADVSSPVTWQPLTLNRADRLSFYFCSGYAFHKADGTLASTDDIAGVGCP